MVVIKLLRNVKRLYFMVIISIFQSAFAVGQSESGSKTSDSLLISIGSTLFNRPTIPPEKTVLVFLIRFVNFGCVPCLNSFVDFCDTLKEQGELRRNCSVVLLFERDNQDRAMQYKQMKAWMNAVGIKFPFSLIPSKVFEEHGISYTSVLIIEHGDRIGYMSQFPLTQETWESISARIVR